MRVRKGSTEYMIWEEKIDIYPPVGLDNIRNIGIKASEEEELELEKQDLYEHIKGFPWPAIVILYNVDLASSF